MFRLLIIVHETESLEFSPGYYGGSPGVICGLYGAVLYANLKIPVI